MFRCIVVVLVLLIRTSAPLATPPRLTIGVKWRRTLSDEWHAAVTSGWAGRCRVSEQHGCLAVLLVGTLTNGPASPARWPDDEPVLDAARQMLLLPIVDSYANLILKTLLFMRWAAATRAPHVMVLDDDTYPDVRRLLALLSRVPPPLARERFLMGEVCFGQPVNDASQSHHPNYLSPACYPLRDLPPWPSGSGFVLSLDLVRHLAAHAPTLLPGTFFACGNHSGEDVQLALWLLALGVAPVHSTSFRQFPAALPDTLVLLNMPRDPVLMRALDAHVQSEGEHVRSGDEPLTVGGELADDSDADAGRGWIFTSPAVHSWHLSRPAAGPGRMPALVVDTAAGPYTFRNRARTTPTLLWAHESLEAALQVLREEQRVLEELDFESVDKAYRPALDDACVLGAKMVEGFEALGTCDERCRKQSAVTLSRRWACEAPRHCSSTNFSHVWNDSLSCDERHAAFAPWVRNLTVAAQHAK